MEYEEYLAKANSGAFQAASPGPPSGKTIAGKRGENITTLLPSSAFQRAMAEQTMVALLWQQGDARGTLNLPASTKVEDLKLRLNASDCDAGWPRSAAPLVFTRASAAPAATAVAELTP